MAVLQHGPTTVTGGATPSRRGTQVVVQQVTSGRAIGRAAVVLAAWGALMTCTPSTSGWRTAVDVVVLAAAHSLAALVALRDRDPGSPGAVPRTALGIGLTAFAVAAVLGRLLEPGPATATWWTTVGLHLLGQAGIAALLFSLVAPLRGRLIAIRIGLDSLSTLLGMTGIAVTVVMLGLGAASLRGVTAVGLALTAVDLVLVSTAVALFFALRGGAGSAVPPLLAGTGLLLASDLLTGRELHLGGSTGGPSYLLTAGACLVLATVASRPSIITATMRLPLADRMATWVNALPAAGATAGMVAVVVAEQFPASHPAVTVLGCMTVAGVVVVGIRFLLTIRVARSAFVKLEDAFTDHMTGLVTRRGLGASVDRWLRDGTPVTVLALDIAGFRRINEDAGHETGDRVLQRVAGQLAALAGPGTVAARLDGDDFALAHPGEDHDRTTALTARIRDVLSRPFVIDGHRLHLTVNIGTAVSHAAVTTTTFTPQARTDGLLRCAGQALAQAKACVSGTAVHDPATCGRAGQDSLLTWVDDLHAALVADDQLVLHFQPQHHIVPSGTGTVTSVAGCEALLRWAHPTRGLLGPREVLRAAEHGHLGPEITERVLDLALRGAASWWGTRETPVSINLSAYDLDDDLLPRRIADALHRHGLPARALTVEVVEDTLMLDPDRAVQTLRALRDAGLRIAVDDYGTGYSSLAYLHRLPVDEVKFDRSLTAGISADPAAAVIIEHSIRLAHDLGLSALAEGIEDPADLDVLFHLGCDAVQGYLTGRPQPLDSWLASLGL